MTTDRQNLLALADQAGTLSGALSNIADEIHTALTDLDILAGYCQDPVRRGVVAALRGRLESLDSYVADVVNRATPASLRDDSARPTLRSWPTVITLGGAGSAFSADFPTDADLGYAPGQAGPQ